MDWTLFWQVTGPVLAVVISFVLYIWSRREKVAIVIHDSYATFALKGTKEIGPGQKLITVNNHSLHIYVSCALVLTSGEKEIEVMGVEIKLHKETCEELKKYFLVPHGNRFSIYKYETGPEGYKELGAILQPKKPVDFTEDRLFECTDNFEERCENEGFDFYSETDDYGEYGIPPDFIKPLLEQLRYKYQICWTRYDGETICWGFPQRWWRNLGRRLWG